MRVTAKTKQETRQKIVVAALALFRTGGYEATTTRQIAARARIGLATLFNYFPTKEAIVESLVRDALGAAREKFADSTAKGATLAEDLFSHIAGELRHLKPYRTFLAPVLDTTLGPLGSSRDPEQGEQVRHSHLETVKELAAKHGARAMRTQVALQLYWTLYTGVLAHWAADESPRQEESLALLDESLGMFANWLQRGARQSK